MAKLKNVKLQREQQRQRLLWLTVVCAVVSTVTMVVVGYAAFGGFHDWAEHQRITDRS